MNKLLLSLPLVLLALALPAAASAGGGNAPDRPVENQIWCGSDAECEPPTEFCEIAFDKDLPVPAQENCIWPEDTCVTAGSEVGTVPDGPVPDECFWPEDPCDVPVSSDDPPRKGYATPDKGEAPPDKGEMPKSDVCEYPDDYCYFEDGSGEGGGIEPGSEGSGVKPNRGKETGPIDDPAFVGPPEYDGEDPGYDDPGDLVCMYELAPTAREKAKAKRRAAARQRVQTRRKAAVKRAQTRRQTARKRAAAKRAKLKAKKAAQARNS